MKCGKCKKEAKFVKRGKQIYVGGIYQMLQCKECGHTQKGELIKKLGEPEVKKPAIEFTPPPKGQYEPHL